MTLAFAGMLCVTTRLIHFPPPFSYTQHLICLVLSLCTCTGMMRSHELVLVQLGQFLVIASLVDTFLVRRFVFLRGPTTTSLVCLSVCPAGFSHLYTSSWPHLISSAIDTLPPTVLRSFLVPGLMLLAVEWNWWPGIYCVPRVTKVILVIGDHVHECVQLYSVLATTYSCIVSSCKRC